MIQTKQGFCMHANPSRFVEREPRACERENRWGALAIAASGPLFKQTVVWQFAIKPTCANGPSRVGPQINLLDLGPAGDAMCRAGLRERIFGRRVVLEQFLYFGTKGVILATDRLDEVVTGGRWTIHRLSEDLVRTLLVSWRIHSQRAPSSRSL